MKKHTLYTFQEQHGLASHPRTVNNMQVKMSQSFDKDVLLWKKELVKLNSEDTFLREVIETQQKTYKDNMELCTIDFNKEAVRNYKSYTEEIYNECISKLPACETNLYDEEDVLAIINSNSANPAKRYRYVLYFH